MSKRPKGAPGGAADNGEERFDGGSQRIRVTAAAGPRRRAGFSFGPQSVEKKLSDLGPDAETAENVFKALQADPQLSVAIVIDEGDQSETEE